VAGLGLVSPHSDLQPAVRSLVPQASGTWPLALDLWPPWTTALLITASWPLVSHRRLKNDTNVG
jgi:hypothetical protein